MSDGKPKSTGTGAKVLIVFTLLFILGVILNAQRSQDRERRGLSADPIIRHLRWGQGPDLSIDVIYGMMKTELENKQGIRIERDGNTITVHSSAQRCKDAIDDYPKLIPNGAEMRCESSEGTEWVQDRR